MPYIGRAPSASIIKIEDADKDTKIQVEESSDEDTIRFDIAGAEDFTMTANSFNVLAGSKIDMNGTELILDADADTSITADTDDQIDIKISGADDFRFTANSFNALSGSTLTIDSGATITNSGTSTGFTDFRGAIAGRNSNQTISNNSWTTITWDAEVMDTDSMFSTGSNPTRITVPTGITQIRCSTFTFLQWHADKTAGMSRMVHRLKKNGSFDMYGFSIYADFAAENYNFMFNTLWPCVVCTGGDYFEIEVFHTTGEDAYVAGNASSNNYDGSAFVMEILK